MDRATNQKELGDSLYIFESKGGAANECLIFGHAGWVESLGSVFTLPTQVSLSFRTHHTEPNVSNPVAELARGSASKNGTARSFVKQAKAARLLLDEHDQAEFSPGSVCKDYILVKGLGYHWDKKNPKDWTYKKLEGFMTNSIWKPHVVSIRNRKAYGTKKYVLLSETIKLVRASYPHVTKFVFAGCRGVHPDWKP